MSGMNRPELFVEVHQDGDVALTMRFELVYPEELRNQASYILGLRHLAGLAHRTAYNAVNEYTVDRAVVRVDPQFRHPPRPERVTIDVLNDGLEVVFGSETDPVGGAR
jgi:hypothetical protein